MNLVIPKTREDFLKSTIEHFNSDALGLDSGGHCSYEGGCAIGRFLNSALAKQFDLGKVGNPTSVDNTVIFNLLPEELKVLGQDFLEKVQKLHDNPAYWSKDGLSPRGKIWAKHISHLYKLNITI